MVMVVDVLIALCRVSSHFIWPLEEWVVLNFLQNLLDQLLEHCINCLGIGRPRLSCIIPSRTIVIVLVRPKISPLLRDNLSLPFSLLLVVFDPFILINSVHKLV